MNPVFGNPSVEVSVIVVSVADIPAAQVVLCADV